MNEKIKKIKIKNENVFQVNLFTEFTLKQKEDIIPQVVLSYLDHAILITDRARNFTLIA